MSREGAMPMGWDLGFPPPAGKVAVECGGCAPPVYVDARPGDRLVPLRAAIAAGRARLGLDAIKEMHCLARFGVGRAMLERIEAGEVVPDGPTEEGIRRGLAMPPGEDFDPLAKAPPRGFFLVKERDGSWRLGFWWNGLPVRIPIEDARALCDGIGPLLAQYDRQFPR